MSTSVEHDLLRFRELLLLDTPEIGLPAPLVRAMKDLIGCDVLSFNRMDAPARTHDFQQEYDGETITVIPKDVAGADDPFWNNFWASTCSLPERTGDFTRVSLSSDVQSDPQLRSAPMHLDGPADERHIHEMMMVLPDGAPGRTLRLIFFRDTGSDFTERDRFYLQLLRPHVADVFARSQARRTATLLTLRQVDVLSFAQLGMTNRQIGRRLDITEGTVRTHMRDIFERLDVTSRTAAIHRVGRLLEATPWDGQPMSPN